MCFKFLLAAEIPRKALLETNGNKFMLVEASYQAADSLLSPQQEEKSALRAALYSAVIPGSGQYYAGSVWKTILFAGLEVVGWTAYFVYTSKGNNKEEEVIAYADAHWSEKKYWSKLYDMGVEQGKIDDIYDVDNDRILIDYNPDVVNELRFLEEALGHTHKLPETKTQQYYEMIYKYLTQFGNGWDDADFDIVYYGNTNRMTPQMFAYRDLRNDMNGFFDSASTATNAILINHVLSALDAAWTTRNYNRQIQMKIRAYNKRYFDENIQMFGINVSW
jgi:hypothetical protein